jgi:hypothetical protein
MGDEIEIKGKRRAVVGAIYALVAIGSVIVFGWLLPSWLAGLIGLSGLAGVFFAYASWKNRRFLR